MLGNIGGSIIWIWSCPLDSATGTRIEVPRYSALR